MSEHTPTPWLYRPVRHDDWGWIRVPSMVDNEVGPLVACARSGQWDDMATHDEHRRNGTDPYGANAAFIVKAVNNHDFLVKALTELLDACESLGDFKNGVTHNQVDEGEVYVSGLIDQARDALSCVGALPPRAPSSQPAESAGAKTGGGK